MKNIEEIVLSINSLINNFNERINKLEIVSKELNERINKLEFNASFTKLETETETEPEECGKLFESKKSYRYASVIECRFNDAVVLAS